MLPEWTPSQATGQRNGTDPAPPYKGPRIVCLGQGSTGTHALFVAAALLGQPAAHYMQEVLAQPQRREAQGGVPEHGDGAAAGQPGGAAAVIGVSGVRDLLIGVSVVQNVLTRGSDLFGSSIK